MSGIKVAWEGFGWRPWWKVVSLDTYPFGWCLWVGPFSISRFPR